MTRREEIEQRLTDLRRKLKARANLPGYRENIAAISAAISTLEEELKGLPSG